jgi:hypothetical protein
MIFTNFKPNSRVWMYISSDIIDDSTQNIISKQFLSFSNTWKSHGDKVVGKLLFLDNYIVVIGADFLGESICGRAVDSQVKFIKDLEPDIGLTLMNRQNVCIKEKNQAFVVPFSNLKELVKNGDVDETTLIYNSMIQSNNEDVIMPITQSPFGEMIFS